MPAQAVSDARQADSPLEWVTATVGSVYGMHLVASIEGGVFTSRPGPLKGCVCGVDGPCPWPRRTWIGATSAGPRVTPGR